MGYRTVDRCFDLLAIKKDGRFVKISPLDKLVLLALARHKNELTGECFPSIDTLAEATGICARRVKLALKVLTSAGVITKRRTRFGGENHYEFMTRGSASEDAAGLMFRCHGAARSLNVSDEEAYQIAFSK